METSQTPTHRVGKKKNHGSSREGKSPQASEPTTDPSAAAVTSAPAKKAAPRRAASAARPKPAAKSASPAKSNRGNYPHMKTTKHVHPAAGGRVQKRRPMRTTRKHVDKRPVPKIEGDNVRVITLGGVEEVGRNMFAVEHKDSIWVFDAGFQFVSEADAPGVDYTLPNITYLEQNKDRIKGLIITHGHLDHIGGIPFLMARMGNPTIYTRNLTAIMIKKRMHEFPNAPKLDIHIVEPGDTMFIGDLEFYFFAVTHSIPDCIATSIRTPHGNIVITGDIKLEHEGGVPVPGEVEHWAEVTKEDNIMLLSDSTNCENPGWSIPEPRIHENVDEIIRNAQGRIMIATFASQFRRMIAFMKSAESQGKKIILEGRSIKTNLEIAKLAGKYTPADGVIIQAADIDKYPSDKILILCTGGQGEQFAALPRMARGDHKYVKLNNRDTVILSSSVIPGNEISVRNLMDQLHRNDVRLISYKTSDVHSTGHGNQEELKWIINTVHPTFMVPAYGYHSMLKIHKRLALETGMDDAHVIVPDNGSVIEIKGKDDVSLLPMKVPSSPIMVDGFSISDMQHTVIADRQLLSSDGIFVTVVSINVAKKQMQKSPDIISRGFVYLRESQDLLSQARGIIKRVTEEQIEKSDGNRIDVETLKKQIHKHLERFLLRKTNKQPIIIPVILVV